LARAAAEGDLDALVTIQRAVKATVKATPKRPKREYESPDIAAFMRRQARGLVKRAGDGDLEALTAIQQTIAVLEAARLDAAEALHDFDYSWTEIGRELNMTRQAARQMVVNRKDRDSD
jgi:hypothetical protein